MRWATLYKDISIHAPRTGSDVIATAFALAPNISIHAPRTGSDIQHIAHILAILVISIHAPRTGSDAKRRELATLAKNFNPRSPHGERRKSRSKPCDTSHFNPRSPHGERLHPRETFPASRLFQSTLPARGATFRAFAGAGKRFLFQSTLPARGATRTRRSGRG